MNATKLIATTLLALTIATVGRAQTADKLTPGGGLMPSEKPATPTDILTAQPTLPPGTYASPWCGENGCAGPVGGNGPITYEIYALVGPSLSVGGGPLSSAIKTGITTGGGARTLWFTRDNTAAWAFDLGITYTYNEGQADQTRAVATPRTAPITTDPFTGQQTGGQRIFPDGIANYQVRNLVRTNFNFGIGRDWWLWGPGSLQSEQGDNLRVGSDIGGRWGTAHVDLVPRADPSNYLKRTGVIHGMYIGLHANGERPVGNWIFTYGVRAEWGYTITNIIPPLGGDIHDINLLFTIGARF